jgi:hypothetical protein
VTFSNRCFPTKAIRGWLAADDAGRVDYVRELFARTAGFAPPESALRTGDGHGGDPLWGVWARRLGAAG